MREVLQSVMALQPAWTADNSEDMELRGYFVRSDGPDWIRDRLATLQSAMPPGVDDLEAEGRDRTGRSSQVPWFRLYSRSRSPKARFGFYVVYLFDLPGTAVYVSLNQGTTRWEDGDLKPLPPDLLAARTEWARSVIAQSGQLFEDLQTSIDLGTDGRLASQYALGNVLAIRYDVGSVPDEDVLLKDLLRMARLLGVVYAAQDSGDVPGELPSEVVDAEEAVGEAAGRPAAARRAGFRPNAAQRRAIELRAMEVAAEHLEASGFTVQDVSTSKPFDLLAKSANGEELHVEVKGTTSSGDQVLLTRGEVEHHRGQAPASALIVVSQIGLAGTAQAPVAAGGRLHVVRPWSIAESALTPVGFQYQVPPD